MKKRQAKSGRGTSRALRTQTPDVPYTMRLPNGRTLLLLIPALWCEIDASGEVAFGPQAVRLLDRVRVTAADVPTKPTQGYIRTLREALGLTQAQLAARVGVDKMTVARWEWGKMTPGRAAVTALDDLRRALARRGVTIAA